MCCVSSLYPASKQISLFGTALVLFTQQHLSQIQFPQCLKLRKQDSYCPPPSLISCPYLQSGVPEPFTAPLRFQGHAASTLGQEELYQKRNWPCSQGACSSDSHSPDCRLLQESPQGWQETMLAHSHSTGMPRFDVHDANSSPHLPERLLDTV